MQYKVNGNEMQRLLECEGPPGSPLFLQMETKGTEASQDMLGPWSQGKCCQGLQR